MLNLVEKFLTKTKSSNKNTRENFKKYFFTQPEHSWIFENKVESHFESLINHLPVGILDVLLQKYPISFIPSTELKLLQDNRVNSIVIFPEFLKRLKNNDKFMVAYLAHELAFVLYALEERSDNSIMAEIEADKFVCDIGLTFELEKFLLILDETTEKRLRLTYLSSYYFSHFEEI